MIIAIDGPSGTGKSTVAALLADRLGFVYFNSGAMYRALAYEIFTKFHETFEDKDILSVLKTFDFDVQKIEGHYKFFSNGEEVTLSIYQEKISKLASLIAKRPFVRECLLPVQRAFGKKGDVIFDGRDIGTIVFPDADLKIYLDAKPEIRAERRLKQYKESFPDKAPSFNYETVLKDVIARDSQDMKREIAPLKKASDAIYLDASFLTIAEVLQKMEQLIDKRGNNES